MTLTDLQSTEYLPYFSHFFSQIDESKNLLDLLQDSEKALVQFFKSISKEKQTYIYAENKWNLKEIINHLIDTERIFNYRALCIARQDKTPLNGFNENEYAAHSYATNRTLEDLIEEFKTVRKATIALFKSFTNDMLLSISKAGSGDVSVRAIGFIIVGHETHHANIFKASYL